MMTPKDIEADNRRRMGAALKSLRRHLGMTQEEVAGNLGMTTQGYQNYEHGRRSLPDAKLNHILTGMNADRAEFDAQLQAQDVTPARERPSSRRAPEGVSYRLPHVGIAVAGEQPFPVSDRAAALETVDLAAHFGPTVRALRISGMGMSPWITQGGLITFDIAQPPRPGQGCVVEMQAGSYRLMQFTGYSGTHVMGRELSPPREIEFALADVAGVYAVGLRVD